MGFAALEDPLSLLLSLLFLASNSNRPVVRDEVFVRLKPSTSVERLAAASAQFGRVEERIKGSSIYVIELKAGVEEERALEKLVKVPGVTLLNEQEELNLRLKSGRPLKERDGDSRPGLDNPEAAMQWRRLAWVDGQGQIPPNAMRRALEQKSKMRQVNSSKLRGDVWQNEGPADLSGRSCIAVVDPKNPLRIWEGTAGGGIWRSLDGGLTWTAIGDGLSSLAVCALALDPNDNTTLYAGTGEGYFNIDAVAGGGVFKSTDGGDTWTLLPGTSTWNWNHINRIAVCPGSPNTILITRQYGGMFLSTDGGNNFTNTLNVQSGHAITFCPTKPSRVIGTVQDYDSIHGNWFEAAVVSNDGGNTWTKATGPLNYMAGFGRIETYPLLKDPNTVYASAFDGNIYKSTDGGQSYVKQTTSAGAGTSWYANAIWVDPTNSNRLVVGGTYVYGSTDGGVNLTRIGAGYIQTDQPHPDIHYFFPAPGYDGVSNKKLYVCTDGGLYVTTDITSATTSGGWSRLDQGIVTTQYYSIAGDGPSGRIIGGLQDNGTQSNVVGNAQASYIYGGDGGYVAIDSTNPLYVFGEYIYLEIFRNSNGGTSGNTSTGIYGGLSDAGTHANFIAPFILDPNQPTTLLAGGASLWRTTNDRDPSPAWSSIRPAGTSNISAIAVAKGNSDIIWVGQNDGGVSMTTNGTYGAPSWTNISTNSGTGPLPNRYVTRILVDPDNSNTVYVTFGGFRPDNVYKTTDGGITWVSISGSGNGALPMVPVRAIARRPGSPNVLYVGTEIGLFSTLDGGNTWTTSSDMNVNVSVDELAYMNNSNTLLAGTHGRGVWMLPYVTATVSGLTINPTSTVGGNTCTGTVTLQSSAPANGVLISLTASSSLVTVPESVFFPAGTTSATFTLASSATSVSQTVQVKASRDATSATANLTIVPPTLSGLSFYPTSIAGGNPAYGTVKLNGLAPAGGVTVTLSTTSTAASIPTSATIPAGSTSFTFTVTTHPVASMTNFPVTAKFGTTTQSATLAIVPPSVISMSATPNPVVGGNPTKVTVNLNGPAPTGGTVVGLSASSADAAPPASATVPAGSTATTVSVPTHAVSTGESITLTAKTGSANTTTSLVIETNTLQSVTFSAPYVVGGSDTAATGTVTFNGPAPASGETVQLKSSNPSAVGVPASIKVAAGSATGTFPLTHHLVTSAQQSTITATFGSTSVTGVFSVLQMGLISVTFSPSSVAGGATSTGTVTLTAPAGSGTGAVTVKLSKSNSPVTIPATVSVPIHKASATFTVTTLAVNATTSATVTASLNGQTKQGALTLTPVPIVSLTLSPASVKGSATTVVTGTVTISAAAPTGGTTVTLSSANSSVAAVPGSVVVPAGKKTVTFKVSHKAVTTKSSVVISGSAGGATKTATLTVTP